MIRNPNTAPTLDAARAELQSAAEPARLAPGTCIAEKYIICDVLGAGGSAIVYAAEQVSLKRVVALKIYPAGALAEQLLRHFEREAQLLALVHHENVIAVFDAGSLPDGSTYLVVQRLDGESLAACLAAGPLPVTEAVALTCQVLAALVALSDVGITHRDVKPDNLVFDRLPEGRTVLKLVDFGIAKGPHDEASRALDEMVGTPYYMAPEQVRGDSIDARCDLYGLAATLYHMLAGRPPHASENVEAVAQATLFSAITPLCELRPDCPEGLSQIIMRALARHPSQRFASARDMKRALDHWQTAHRAATKQQAKQQREPLADTLRIPTLQAGLPARRGLRKRSTLAVSCAAALACVVLAHDLSISSLAMNTSGQVGAQLLAASESSAFELVIPASARASALLVETSAELVTLLSRGLGAARALLVTKPYGNGELEALLPPAGAMPSAEAVAE